MKIGTVFFLHDSFFKKVESFVFFVNIILRDVVLEVRWGSTNPQQQPGEPDCPYNWTLPVPAPPMYGGMLCLDPACSILPPSPRPPQANSAILNALLTLLNERAFDDGAFRLPAPLLCAVGASNELPESEELEALYDRFLLRRQVSPGQALRGVGARRGSFGHHRVKLELAVQTDPIEADTLHWNGILTKGAG